MSKKVFIGMSVIVVIAGIIGIVRVAMIFTASEVVGKIPTLFFGGAVLAVTAMSVGLMWSLHESRVLESEAIQLIKEDLEK